MNCTIISLVNSLDNILSYDKVMILENGAIVESGQPTDLLRDKSSKLYQRLELTDVIHFRKIMKSVSRFSLQLGNPNPNGSMRLSIVEVPRPTALIEAKKTSN